MNKEDAVDKLVSFWNNHFDVDTFKHDEDYDFIKEKEMLVSDCRDFSDYKTYLDKLRNPQKEYEKEKYKFHPYLYPVPYCGDLKNAEIFILGLNPGLDDSDYHDELDEDFESSLKGNLSQQFTDKDYPLFYLDPKFCWTGGGRYWTRKFSSIIELMITKKKATSYIDALQKLSKKIPTG